jgi:hypothetical protein
VVRSRVERKLTRPQVRAGPLYGAGFGMGQCRSVRERERVRMKTLCCFAATAALLILAPVMTRQAMAQQLYGSGGGSANIWSSAQGTSDSYGNANGFANSSSGSMATGGGKGLSGAGGFGGGITSAITTSTAGASTSGSGYAQVQTSGYAGGNASGYGARGR